LIKRPKEKVKAEALMREWTRFAKGYKYMQLEKI